MISEIILHRTLNLLLNRKCNKIINTQDLQKFSPGKNDGLPYSLMYVTRCNFQYVTECVGVDCQQCGRFYNGFLNIHLVIRQRKVRRFHQQCLHSHSPSAE